MLLTVTGGHTPDALNTPGLSWRPIACIFGTTGLGSQLPWRVRSRELEGGEREPLRAGELT